MGRLLLLEPFDQPEPASADAAPSAEWRSGHDAGRVEGIAFAEARQVALRDDVAQALIDLSFTYAEARTQILSSLVPLFSAIIDRFLPDLAKHALLPHVMDRLQMAARTDSAAPIRITVHPSALNGLTESLPTGMPLPFLLESDPDVPDGQVLLRHRSQETTLDLDGLLRGTRAILSALVDETDRKIQHG